MKIQIRYRAMVLAALAISLLAISAFPQTAFAGQSNNGKSEIAQERQSEERGRANAPGHADDQAAENSASSADQPSAGTPTAGDHPEDYSNHDQTNGPGGQVCDGDPNNAQGAGGNYENTCPAGPSQNGAGDGNANGKPCAGCVGNADDKNPKGQAPDGPNDHNNGYECDRKGQGENQGNNGVGWGNPAHTGCQSTPETPCTPTAENHHCDTDCVPSNANHHCDTDCVPSNTNHHCDTDCVPSNTNHHCDTDCVPSNANHQCGTPKCPNGDAMPASGDVKDCNKSTPKCPNGDAMPASGNVADCNPPCVASATNVCNQSTPSCVASASEDRCGGTTAVLGETLAKPAEPLQVLGVQISQPAPAGLARTGSQLLGLVQMGFVLAFAGLALTVVTRRRRTVNIASRIGE
jgi:hypothetical protein